MPNSLNPCCSNAALKLSATSSSSHRSAPDFANELSNIGVVEPEGVAWPPRGPRPTCAKLRMPKGPSHRQCVCFGWLCPATDKVSPASGKGLFLSQNEHTATSPVSVAFIRAQRDRNVLSSLAHYRGQLAEISALNERANPARCCMRPSPNL